MIVSRDGFLIIQHNSVEYFILLILQTFLLLNIVQLCQLRPNYLSFKMITIRFYFSHSESREWDSQKCWNCHNPSFIFGSSSASSEKQESFVKSNNLTTMFLVRLCIVVYQIALVPNWLLFHVYFLSFTVSQSDN